MHWMILLVMMLGWEEMMRRQPAERPTNQVSQSAPVERPGAAEPRTRPGPPQTSEPPAVPPRTEPVPQPAREKPTAQAAAPPAPPARPTVYQLADSSGQVWTHANPEWLRQWVAQRNQTLAAAATPKAPLAPWFLQNMGGCPPGGCPR